VRLTTQSGSGSNGTLVFGPVSRRRTMQLRQLNVDVFCNEIFDQIQARL
jgi:hypothetical protein